MIPGEYSMVGGRRRIRESSICCRKGEEFTCPQRGQQRACYGGGRTFVLWN